VHTAEIEARQRLELDLHDGPQEQLVLAALTLRRAAAHASGTAAERLLAEALEQLQDGLAALRDLGRRIHPYVLSRYGLATALEGLAARVPVPIELRVTRERLQPALEAAIYSTVAEALANVAQHAAATRATVAVWRAGDAVVAEVVDDGIGGAVATGWSGLRRLAAAAEAFSGRLELDSPPGAGTRLRAVFPARIDPPERSRQAPCAHRLHAVVDLAARGSS
jgi:signal transduction histidine kinase